MDETAIAFEPPHARASATHDGPPLDRISVRDYVRDEEIGAFSSERGVTQRIRFNVVLEVAHTAAAATDDVDQVVSYDMITDAIEAALAVDRLNLLETLAERVAANCLADPRSVRVFVRVEKLDRIPGTLGVEIVRRRYDEAAPRLRPVAEPPAPERRGPGPMVLHLPHSVATGAGGKAWRDAIAATGRAAVVCLDPDEARPAARTEAQRRIGLLAIEQAAWAFCEADPRFDVVAARTELDWALRHGRLSVWAPGHMLAAARGAGLPDAGDPLALAAWLAREIGADRIVAVGAAVAEPISGLPLRTVASDRPDLLATPD